MRLVITIILIHTCAAIVAQQTQGDTSRLLQEIVIEAYENNRRLDEVPASIGFLNGADLQRYNNTSILPAVNIVPGVRMEERSPGSYRFSIRGSSLRSPFGVRNVKAYWNGLPFTDGGGNTYLNLLDFSSIGTLEVIKGPGGSLYGAGTGGVLLIKSPEVRGDQIQASTVFGSYGLQRYLL
ncbi:MAG TPA: Plug domain-containing protein, partial [Chryseosolibacter sp.]|nr:Plug domain-containing protein [Chryseosolibacter sp.]